MPGSFILIAVVMLMFLVLVAAAAAVAAWALSRSGLLGGTAPERTVEPAPAADDLALEIARRRFARGEITRDEYEAIRRDLDA
ncbi:MAG: SHOCT domain-containing protein [Anaerolineae bacterium]|nr:SHOCT domain-containing protein [Anaerolineae bacterium]